MLGLQRKSRLHPYVLKICEPLPLRSEGILSFSQYPWCNVCMNVSFISVYTWPSYIIQIVMPNDGAQLINLLCQPTTETLPTRKQKDNTSVIEELKVLNAGIGLIYKNQKVIIQNQKDIADKLQIDLTDPRNTTGTTRKFQKKAYRTLASFLGILMILGFIGIIIAIHGHHLKLNG